MQGKVGNKLNPTHRRIAMMRAAGMGYDAIAHCMEVTEVEILNVLRRPDVAKYLMCIEGTFVEDLRPVAKRVNETLARHAEEAAAMVYDIMRDMRTRDDVSAQRLALQSAQDILDRAGHRAIQRAETHDIHALEPAQLESLAQVFREVNDNAERK